MEFIPEVLLGASYRKSLTTLFPRFLKVMASYHEEDIRTFIRDAFGYEGETAESTEKIVELFVDMGIDMYFDGETDQEHINSVSIDSMLKPEEIVRLIEMSMR